MARIIEFGSWSRAGDEGGAVSAVLFSARGMSGKGIGSITSAITFALAGTLTLVSVPARDVDIKCLRDQKLETRVTNFSSDFSQNFAMPAIRR